MSSRHLFFAMTGAQALTGGIARSNFNVLGALIELAAETNSRLTILSFLEKNSDRPVFAPAWVHFKGFDGKKGRFAWELLSGAMRRSILVFDHVTLALPVLPLAAAGLIKTIIFAHGSESWKLPRQSSLWSFQCAAVCLTNSHFTLRKMRDRIPKLNGVACPLGLSPEFSLKEEAGDTHAQPIELEAADGRMRHLRGRCLLLVARMDPTEGLKGHRALINIMPGLIHEFPDAQLVFAGPGDDRPNLRQLAITKGVAHAMFLPGFVPTETLQGLYRHCYAFVMPSRQEGFGLAYLEAMNYAKPCVGCFDQGAEDVIVHGETGYLVHDPDDGRELLGILRTLLRDSHTASLLGKRGFERLRQHFTANHYQQRTKLEISRVL